MNFIVCVCVPPLVALTTLVSGTQLSWLADFWMLWVPVHVNFTSSPTLTVIGVIWGAAGIYHATSYVVNSPG